ncbi:hypothetical protein [Shewanella benthica]|nr:hypothetical protein [Shewanella benthica]
MKSSAGDSQKYLHKSPQQAIDHNEGKSYKRTPQYPLSQKLNQKM